MIENYRNDTFILAFTWCFDTDPFTLTALVAGTIKGNLVLFYWERLLDVLLGIVWLVI